MKVIYHDYGGSHSTMTAAWLHLNRLPKDRIPTAKELMDIPLYDTAEQWDHGRIKYFGDDENGHQVYIVGRENSTKIIVPALQDMYTIANGDINELLFIDTMQAVNVVMMIGGFTSRALHLVPIGRPIIIKGTQMAFPRIVKLVESVKLKLQTQ